MLKAISYLSYLFSGFFLLVLIGAVGGMEAGTMGIIRGLCICCFSMAGWVLLAICGECFAEEVE